MKDKISSYTKWFEPSRFMPRPALRAAMRTNDAPQWPISHQDGKKVGPPSGPADSIALYPFEFEVPFETDEQGNQIPIQAKCDVKLTEDDWGDAKIDDILVVDMTSSTHGQEAGPEGGHTEWTLSGTCKVESGNHHLVTSNENIKYSNPKGNVAVCRYTLDVRPIEPGGQKKLNLALVKEILATEMAVLRLDRLSGRDAVLMLKTFLPQDAMSRQTVRQRSCTGHATSALSGGLEKCLPDVWN